MCKQTLYLEFEFLFSATVTYCNVDPRKNDDVVIITHEKIAFHEKQYPVFVEISPLFIGFLS